MEHQLCAQHCARHQGESGSHHFCFHTVAAQGCLRSGPGALNSRRGSCLPIGARLFPMELRTLLPASDVPWSSPVLVAPDPSLQSFAILCIGNKLQILPSFASLSLLQKSVPLALTSSSLSLWILKSSEHSGCLGVSAAFWCSCGGFCLSSVVVCLRRTGDLGQWGSISALLKGRDSAREGMGCGEVVGVGCFRAVELCWGLQMMGSTRLDLLKLSFLQTSQSCSECQMW